MNSTMFSRLELSILNGVGIGIESSIWWGTVFLAFMLQINANPIQLGSAVALLIYSGFWFGNFCFLALGRKCLDNAWWGNEKFDVFGWNRQFIT